MFLLGAGSFILDMLDRQFVLLSWVDNWGTSTGNIIRIALIVVGAGLWLAARRGSSEGAE